MPSSRGGFFLPQAPETLGEVLLVLHLQLKLTNQPKLKPKPKQKTGICLIGLSDIVLPVALKLQSVPEISEKFMKTQTVGSTLQGRDTSYCSDKCSKEILGYLTWCEQTLDFLPPEPTFLSLFGFPVHAAGVHALWSAKGGASEVMHQAMVCRNVFLAGSMTAL